VLFDLCTRHAAKGLIVDTLREYVDYPELDRSSLVHWLDRSDFVLPMADKQPALTVVRVTPETAADLAEITRDVEIRADARPVVLLIDEVSYWSKPNWTAPGLDRLIRYGRHVGVHLVACGRRAAEVSRELTAQLTVTYLFTVREPRDLAFWSAHGPAGLGAILPRLKPHHYVTVQQDGTYAVRSPIRI
jgi:hypothetical protein